MVSQESEKRRWKSGGMRERGCGDLMRFCLFIFRTGFALVHMSTLPVRLGFVKATSGRVRHGPKRTRSSLRYDFEDFSVDLSCCFD